MATERILVVDDDREIVRLVTAYLKQAGYTVLTAFDGETALHTLKREKPDLLLLDLMLPDRDGWDITRLIRRNDALKTLPIIMLTARIDDTDKIIGLELGADDYITKPFNPREVVARVRSQLRRIELDHEGPNLRGSILEIGALRLDSGQRAAWFEGHLLDLTPTEFDLLHTFMDNPGYAFTRDELIELALGYAYAGMGRTLDSHIKNIRRKLEPDPKKPVYIQTVYGIGYKLVGETP